jgi:aminoglycoside phosphotransferase (APT) family kinase protein
VRRLELREEVVPDVLADLGLIARGVRPEVRPLSGGIANAVFSARWDGGAVVLKQALAELRVPAEWSFDTARTQIERDCLEYLANAWPAGATPAVLGFDVANGILAMSHAPDGGQVWKEQLLAGSVEARVATRVGRLLGTLHRRAAADAQARDRFSAIWPLVQGRVDPYHRTAAAAHPDLREPILAEVERLLATRQTLVLGDCSPKNVIAYADRVLMLDFEVAHWGDPAFDIAFLLTHLVLKARRAPDLARPLRHCASAVLGGYCEAAEALPPPNAIVAELGCLLLSRIDGKSPVEYLTAEHDHSAVRATSRRLLTEQPTPLERALDLSFETVTHASVASI